MAKTKKTAEAKKAAEAAAEQAETTGGADIRDPALSGIEGTLVAVAAPRGLNLRSGPSAACGALEVLPDGAVLVKLELPYGASVPGWALVHTGQRAGWAAERYLLTLEG